MWFVLSYSLTKINQKEITNKKGHWFCEDCIKDCYSKKQICPYCMTPVLGFYKDKLSTYYVQKFSEIEKFKQIFTQEEKERREKFIKEKQEEMEKRYALFDIEKGELMKLQEVLKTQVSKLESDYQNLSQIRNQELIQLQSAINEKKMLLEKEKLILNELQENKEKNNNEIISMKEKIEQLNEKLKEDSDKKEQLQRDNEKMKEKLRTERNEVLNRLMKNTNNGNKINNNNNINNDLNNNNNNNESNIPYIQPIFDFFFPNPQPRLKQKLLTEFVLLEAKGNSKKSLVRKAIFKGGEKACALKLIKKKDEKKIISMGGLSNSILNLASNFTQKSLWGSVEEVDLSLYRESMFLQKIDHPSLLTSLSFVKCPSTGAMYIEMPYYEYDVEFLCYHSKNDLNVKGIMSDLLKGISYLHANSAIHRSLTPDCLLSSDLYSSSIIIGSLSTAISEYNVAQDYYFNPKNLSYSAPELLYLSPSQIPVQYWQKIDIWAIGCIFAFLLLGRNLFSGLTTKQILTSIANIAKCRPLKFDHLPSDTAQLLRETFPQTAGFENIIVNASPDEIDLLTSLLQFEPERRITAQMALQHPYFGNKNLFEMSLSDISMSDIKFVQPNSNLVIELQDSSLQSFYQNYVKSV